MEYSFKVNAKNSKVSSSLRGVISSCHDGILFTFRAKYSDGSRFQGNVTFSSIDELTDYLVDDCGCDSLSFNKI